MSGEVCGGRDPPGEPVRRTDRRRGDPQRAARGGADAATLARAARWLVLGAVWLFERLRAGLQAVRRRCLNH